MCVIACVRWLCPWCAVQFVINLGDSPVVFAFSLKNSPRYVLCCCVVRLPYCTPSSHQDHGMARRIVACLLWLTNFEFQKEKYVQTTANTSLISTTALAGAMCGQLFFGAISDFVGRRILFMVTLVYVPLHLSQ